MYHLPNIVRVIRILKWAGHVVRMEEGGRAFKILTGRPIAVLNRIKILVQLNNKIKNIYISTEFIRNSVLCYICDVVKNTIIYLRILKI